MFPFYVASFASFALSVEAATIATTIAATSEGVTDTAILTVSIVPVVTVTISPDSSEVYLGGQRSFTVALFEAQSHAASSR